MHFKVRASSGSRSKMVAAFASLAAVSSPAG